MDKNKLIGLGIALLAVVLVLITVVNILPNKFGSVSYDHTYLTELSVAKTSDFTGAATFNGAVTYNSTATFTGGVTGFATGTMAMLNASTTNVDTLTVYKGSTLGGLSTATDLRPSMLNASSTNIGTLFTYGAGTIVGNATFSTFTASGNATTSNLLAVGATSAATTTITVGGTQANGAGGACLKLRSSGGWLYCYASGSGITCSATSCE